MEFGGRRRVTKAAGTLLAVSLSMCPLAATGQVVVNEAGGRVEAPLPETPEIAPATADPAQTAAGGANPITRRHEAGTFDRFIDPSEIAPRLSVGDKILTGMRASVSDFAVAGWVGSALYGQAFDRSPNYGQNFKGFSQRLGAAAARNTSESIFSDSVFSPIFHTDPRYYQLGPGHGTVHRAAYAVSRVFITKTDGGAQTVNFALLSGNLAGATLTQLYYPGRNRSPGQVFETFGTSLGGSAVGYLIGEFFAQQISSMLRLKSE